MRVSDFGAEDVARDAELLALSPLEARLLSLEHPFLRVGRWRGFGTQLRGAQTTRLVASVDPRQQDQAGPVGCLGFVRLGAGGPANASALALARRVLEPAVAWLQSEGVATVRCPVQFATWYSHRAMTDGFPGDGGMQPFSFEPTADRALPLLLGSGGFTPAHRSVSCLVPSSTAVEQTEPVLGRLRAAGIRDRPLDVAEVDGELKLLYRLSIGIFRDAWGLSEISFEEFASIYRPLAAGVDDRLIRILEDGDGRPIGFALALAADGLTEGTVEAVRGVFVLKTLGVTEDARLRHPGLGAALAGMSHRAALEQGYTAGIHAFMAEGSTAHRISLHWGHQIRSYATFEKGVT